LIVIFLDVFQVQFGTEFEKYISILARN